MWLLHKRNFAALCVFFAVTFFNHKEYAKIIAKYRKGILK